MLIVGVVAETGVGEGEAEVLKDEGGGREWVVGGRGDWERR